MFDDFLIPAVLMIAFLVFYQYMYPALRQYQNYNSERKELEKKYNRLLRARKDLLNHFDWANARGESLDKTESMGREIERMDQEMADIQ